MSALRSYFWQKIIIKNGISSTDDHGGRTSRRRTSDAVVLKGWVDGHRDFGGMLFIDLRDRSGKAQCVVSERLAKDGDGIVAHCS